MQTQKKKRRGWIIFAAIFAAAVLLFCLAAHTLVVIRGGERILALGCDDSGAVISGLPEKKADCILILGAGLRGNSPSPMLRERLDLGAALYHAGAADKILVTGDNGSADYNEVQVMESYLAEQKGVPREAIVRDHAGFSTYDSMVRAKEIFCVNSAVIVTQKYHLFRADYIASCVGIEAWGADAHRTDYAGREAREARECLARVKDFAFCIFRPDPVFLGEKIPIGQDG